uniref:Archease n=1 Tax=candidate division WOR-3 bacterium TaxID=2052148 RepID=A0A7C6EJL1_UNCW3
MPYKYLNHTADLGIEVEGKTLEELFINTGKAIFETQIDGEIDNKEKLSFELKSVSLEELLIEWCRELLYNFAVKGFIPKDYNIKITSGYELNACLTGDIFDKKRHQVKLEIKNATYHNLSIDKKNDKYIATIIFDV